MVLPGTYRFSLGTRHGAAAPADGAAGRTVSRQQRVSGADLLAGIRGELLCRQGMSWYRDHLPKQGEESRFRGHGVGVEAARGDERLKYES